MGAKAVRFSSQQAYDGNLHRGIAFLNNYQFQDASSIFNNIIIELENRHTPSLKPILVEAHAQQALVLLKSGQDLMDRQKAYDHLEKALKLDQSHELANEKMLG